MLLITVLAHGVVHQLKRGQLARDAKSVTTCIWDPLRTPPPYTPLWPSFGISLTRNKIQQPVGWALSLGSKSGLSGLDFMYSGLPIGTAVGHFWLAFDCVGQAGRGLLFRVVSNVFPPFPQSATERADSATTRKLKRPPEALMQQKLVQGT